VIELLRRRLHESASVATVPPLDLPAVLRRGRRRRLARRAFAVVGGGVAAAVIVTVVVVGDFDAGPSPDEGHVDPAAAGPSRTFYERVGPFASGTTVYVGSASVDLGAEISGLYATSIGALVRTGSDYHLVNPDGDTRKVVTLTDRVVGTEPDSTHLAYSAPAGDDRWDLVVLDVATGEELARTTVESHWLGGWQAPPTVIDGTHTWTRLGEGWVEFDWQSGDTRLLPGTADNVYEFGGGRYAVQRAHRWTVHEASDGTQVATVATDPDDYAFISPDGRYLKVWDQDTMTERSPERFELVDLDTGQRIAFPVGLAAHEVQWSPDGRLTAIDEQSRRVSSCDPATAHCVPVDLSIVDGHIWPAGSTSED
jgi:hypothetical protein